MGLRDLSTSGVNAALDEYDQLGAEAFLSKYGFGPAKDYLVIRDGKEYDSKAVAGAAHGYVPGRQPLRADAFNGGEATVARRLRALGFRVPPQRSPPWVRDEVILARDLVAENDWHYLVAEDPRVIELSDVLQRFPFHPADVRSYNFRNANGVARKTVDIATHHPEYTGGRTKGGAIDELVLQQFFDDPARMHAVAIELRKVFKDNTLTELMASTMDDEDAEAQEGRLLQRRHFVRERDKALRAKKVADFLKTHSTVHCEVCGFDFESFYGARGQAYIEVHHTLPLHASGERKTKLKDLILLCANCHRMIHRSAPWLTPDGLRTLLDTTSG